MSFDNILSDLVLTVATKKSCGTCSVEFDDRTDQVRLPAGVIYQHLISLITIVRFWKVIALN